NCAGDLVGVDAAELRGSGEVALAAIRIGHRGAAAVTLGEALIDAVAVRFIGDDEGAAVGERGRGGQNGSSGKQTNEGTHGGQDRERRGMPISITLKPLKMINHTSSP